MSAQQLLSSYGVTMQQAYDFVVGHLHSPQTIVSVAIQFNITNDMLAEIVNTQMTGVTGAAVKNFFAGFGIDSSVLDTTSDDQEQPPAPPSNPTSGQQTVVIDPAKLYTAILDAGTGSYHYVLNLSGLEGDYGFELQNFSADDKVSVSNILNPDVHSTDLGFGKDVVMTFFARTEGSVGITFADVNPTQQSILTIGQFNALLVGDVLIA